MTTCFVRWFTRVCERTRTRPTFSVPGRTKHRLRKTSHGGRLKVATQSCSRPASSKRKEEPIIAAAVVAADGRALSPRCPELVPILPHDRGSRFETNTRA
jgi:hypothetical protein